MDWRKLEWDKMGTWPIACACPQNCGSLCFKGEMSVLEELSVLNQYNRALSHADEVKKWVEIMHKEATSVISQLIYSSFESLVGASSQAKSWVVCVTVCTEHWCFVSKYWWGNPDTLADQTVSWKVPKSLLASNCFHQWTSLKSLACRNSQTLK